MSRYILFIFLACLLKRSHALITSGLNGTHGQSKRTNFILVQPYLKTSHLPSKDYETSTHYERILNLEKEVTSLRVQFPLGSEVPMESKQKGNDQSRRTETGTENQESKPLFSLMPIFCFVCAVVSMRKTVSKIYQDRQIKKIMKEIMEQDDTYDIAYAACPTNFDNGSIYSPWTGDLNKFDV